MKTLGGVKSENGVSSKEVSTPNSEPEKIDFSKVKVEPLFEEDVDFDTFSNSEQLRLKNALLYRSQRNSFSSLLMTEQA
jgi:hypothetical protein